MAMGTQERCTKDCFHSLAISLRASMYVIMKIFYWDDKYEFYYTLVTMTTIYKSPPPPGINNIAGCVGRGRGGVQM